MSAENQTQTGKFYTAARKIPQLIGVTPTGERIPGGPYTPAQFGLGIATLVLGFITRPLWGHDEIISESLIIIAAATGITYGTGKLPRSRRSLINLVNCCLALLSRPRTGKYRGRKIPASYSKVKPRKGPKPGRPSTTSEHTRQEQQGASGPEPVQINSGLDRLTADLTTARS